MKTKLLGIFVCMLLIATAVPAVGTINKTRERFDFTSFKSNPNMNNKNACYMPSSLIEWEKTYGGPKADKFWAVKQTNDNGYIACGTTGTTIPYQAYSCPWVVKVDSTGNEEWNWTIQEFTYNDTDFNITYCWSDDVQQTTDGGYIACLMLIFNYDAAEHQLGGLVKLDANGAQEWMQIFGDEFEWTILPEELMVVDDGYIGVGAHTPTRDETYIDGAACMFKTNNLGELQWYQTYNQSPIYEWARSFCPTDDGYIMAGDVGIAPGEWHALIIKTDANGIEEWNKTYSDGLGFSNILPTTGGYMLAGSTDVQGAGSMDAWLVKIDTNGNRIWNKTFGESGYDACHGFDAIDNDCFIMAAIINWAANADAWVIKLDSDGNVIWKEIYGGTGSQYFVGICSTSDGGCIASGILGEWDWLPSDALLVKYAPFPNLEMEINGGLGVGVSITNNGLGDAIGVPYDLTVTGGILDMINKTVNGTIDIEAGATESISSGLLFGLGGIEITVKVGVKEETAQGIQFLIFSIVS